MRLCALVSHRERWRDERSLQNARRAFALLQPSRTAAPARCMHAGVLPSPTTTSMVQGVSLCGLPQPQPLLTPPSRPAQSSSAVIIVIIVITIIVIRRPSHILHPPAASLDPSVAQHPLGLDPPRKLLLLRRRRVLRLHGKATQGVHWQRGRNGGRVGGLGARQASQPKASAVLRQLQQNKQEGAGATGGGEE